MHASQQPASGATCSFGDDAHVFARGWCQKHYTRWLRHGDPLATEVIVGDDVARFTAKVDRSGGPEACWPYTDKPNVVTGYGHFYVSGREALAHVFAYELWCSPVPGGMELDHRCHVPQTCEPRDGLCPHRRCCNPAHLKPVTHRENCIRSGGVKLDDERVEALYTRRQAGETMRSLAEESGVAKRTLQRRFRQYATWVCEAEGRTAEDAQEALP